MYIPVSVCIFSLIGVIVHLWCTVMEALLTSK